MTDLLTELACRDDQVSLNMLIDMSIRLDAFLHNQGATNDTVSTVEVPSTKQHRVHHVPQFTSERASSMPHSTTVSPSQFLSHQILCCWFRSRTQRISFVTLIISRATGNFFDRSLAKRLFFTDFLERVWDHLLASLLLCQFSPCPLCQHCIKHCREPRTSSPHGNSIMISARCLAKPKPVGSHCTACMIVPLGQDKVSAVIKWPVPTTIKELLCKFLLSLHPRVQHHSFATECLAKKGKQMAAVDPVSWASLH